MKYLIFDLDDTLLNEERKISDYTIEVLNKAKANGFKLVINTARNITQSSYFNKVLDFDYFITDGGVQIFDSNLNLINQKLIDLSLLNTLINELNKIDEIQEITVQCLDGLFTNDYDYSLRNKRAKYSDLTNLLTPSTKILIKCDNELSLIPIKEKYNLILVKYFDSNIYRLSLSNKYLGNMLLKETLNDEDFQDYCFGDDNGDIEMINNAFHGVLMQNAKEELKQKVSNITKYPNTQDGCAKYILENVMYV